MQARLLNAPRPGGFSIEQPRNERPEAQPGIQELRALQLEGDLAAPEHADGLFGPWVALYRGEGTTGDELLLPPAARLEARALSPALARVVRAGAELPGLDADAQRRVDGMCQTLSNFVRDGSEIRRRAAFGRME